MMLLRYTVIRTKYQILGTTLGYKKPQQTHFWIASFCVQHTTEALYAFNSGNTLFIFLIQPQTQKCLTSFYSAYQN